MFCDNVVALRRLSNIKQNTCLIFTIVLLLSSHLGCTESAKASQRRRNKQATRQGGQSGHYRRTQFIERLFHTYDRRVLPNLEGPTTVNCSLFINNFDSISEVTMDYAVGVYLRQAWVDPRLRFNPAKNNNESMVTLDAKSFDKLWVPDLFFTNEKRASFHSITVPNRLIRLNPVGTVLYSVRLSLTLSCVMDLRKFPLDRQVCTMMIESYAYTTDKIILQWRSDPLEVSKDLMIPQFYLRHFDFADCSKRYATGNFSCLKASFYLDRDVGYYIIQTYLPSVLVVVLSWVAFWIDPAAVPARVTFGVFTTLILSTMSSSVRSTLPRVSYVKAIDVWMSVCMFFVFTALIEYAIVNVVLRQKAKRPLKPLKPVEAKPAVEANRASFRTSRTPVNDPSGPLTSHLLVDEADKIGEVSFSIGNTPLAPGAVDGNGNGGTDVETPRPHFRGSIASKGPLTGDSSEIWIPLESRSPLDPSSPRQAKRGKVPSTLKLNREEVTATPEPPVVDESEVLLMRGPAHPLDLLYYWHRMMIRLSHMEGKEKGQVVENWARKIFPLSFILFNVVYWLVYLYWI